MPYERKTALFIRQKPFHVWQQACRSVQGQPVFHIFGQDGTQATLCSRTGQADCRRFQWLLYRCIGMVAFYFRTPTRIPGNMQVWVPAIIFCVLSCMKTGYHDDGPEDMVQSPDRSESLYVTGVEYPSGYDWSSGKYDSTTASLLFLMKDGKRIRRIGRSVETPVCRRASLY